MNKRYCPRLNPARIGTGRHAAEKLHRQLKEELARENRRHAGVAIQSARQLGEAIGIDRTVVQKVYEHLYAEGFLEKHRSGRRYLVKSTPGAGFISLGIVLPMRFSDYIMNPLDRGRRQMLFNGIIDRAQELHCSLALLELPPRNAPETEAADYLDRTLPGLSGVIHLGDRGYQTDLPLAMLLADGRVPQAAASADFQLPHIGSVNYDPVSATAAVGQLLRGFGHRDLAIIKHLPKTLNNPRCEYGMNDTEELTKCFKSAGMNVKSEWIGELDPVDLPGSTARFLEAVLKRSDCPAAFWCRGDLAALELMKQLQARGYRIPEDFSVVGMDDIPDAAAGVPPLATLRQPVYDLGAAVVEMLMEFRFNGVNEVNRTRRLPPILVPRESVGRRRIKSDVLF